MSSPSPIIKGLTTIRWGTSGFGGATALASAIVTSIEHSRMGGPPTLISDSAGFTQAWVGLNDGDKLVFNCVDDTALTWPAFGDDLVLKNPGESGTKSFIVEDDDTNLARKREGQRRVTACFYASGVIHT